MANKRTATCMAETLAVFLLFVTSGEAGLSGFVVSDLSEFDPLPEINYLQDPTSPELKKKIVSALKSLSIDGKQSCLVQYWAATNAGKAHLLATTHQPFGIFGNYEGLELYRKACLHHKLYVHREGKTSFGLPGHAFEDRTPHQTQNMHDYPEDQRPLCEDKAIFSKKWGSFAVPVILDNVCIGVLEFVDTEPTHTYDGDINVVKKALKCAGFESFNMSDTINDTHIPNKRQRKTNSSMYNHYNVLVPYFGKKMREAMKAINDKFFPEKLTETTRDATDIPEYSAGKAKRVNRKFKVITSTFKNALAHVGITEWPYVRNSKASRAPKTRINPMASDASTFRSLNAADGFAFSFVKEEASECSLERTTFTNTSALKDIDFNILGKEIPELSESRTDETLLDSTSFFGSLNADNSTACLVQGEASERSLERITITNTSALETYYDQTIYCSTSTTEALPETENARPKFLPEDNRSESQDHETTFLDAPDHFVMGNVYSFPRQEIFNLSESRTAQTLCDKTSSIRIPDNAGDLNYGWYKDLDQFILEQENRDLYETLTDQTLLDGTSFFGSLNADDLTFCLVQEEASEWSLEGTTVANTSAQETHYDQVVSCSTSYTEALPHETTNLDALDHFGQEIDYNSPGKEIPDLSESRTDETLRDKSSSIGNLDNSGDFSSSWDKGVHDGTFELITTTNTSPMHESPITSFEQESCEMGDDFFPKDFWCVKDNTGDIKNGCKKS